MNNRPMPSFNRRRRRHRDGHVGLRQVAGDPIHGQSSRQREGQRIVHSCLHEGASRACGVLILAIDHAGSVTLRAAPVISVLAAARVRMPQAQIASDF